MDDAVYGGAVRIANGAPADPRAPAGCECGDGALVDLIYQAALDARLWPRVIAALRRMAGAAPVAVWNDGRWQPSVACDEGGRGVRSPAGRARAASVDTPALRGLHTHLRRALAISQALAQAQRERAEAWAVLDRLGVAVIVLAAQGLVERANRAAHALWAPGAALALRAGRLVAAAPGDARALSALLARAGDGSSEGGTALLRAGGSRPLLALAAAPLPCAGSGPRVLLLSFDRSQTSVAAVRMLAGQFGWTPAETRVVSGLLSGIQLKDVARRHGVTLNTVRAQLRNVFAKAAICRQAELVDLVRACPPLRGATTPAPASSDRAMPLGVMPD